MNRVQNSIVLFAVFFLLANGALSAALADHDDHKEKRWYQRIFDWDDDDHHDDDDDDHVVIPR